MNVNGLKKLIRNERTDLLIDVCDATTFKDICQISVGNLIQQETEFDRWEVEWFHSCFDFDDEYDTEDDILDGFVLSLGVNPREQSDNEAITTIEAIGIFDNDYGTVNSMLMSYELVDYIRNIRTLSPSEQKKVQKRSREYNALIVDEITIRFNEITMMDIWDDYEGDADEIMEDRYFIDTMSIDIYPKLPDGTYQFSL